MSLTIHMPRPCRVDWPSFLSSPSPVPSTPVVVAAVLQSVGDPPTPPFTPRTYATPIVDDHAPCPPTPHCVSSCTGCSTTPILQDPTVNDTDTDIVDDHASCPPTPHCVPSCTGCSTTSILQDPTVNDTDTDIVAEPSDQPQPVPVAHPDAANASDSLLYAREAYALPSPVLIVIQRARFDEQGLCRISFHPWATGQPFKMFSLTGGHTPKTGFNRVDRQSLAYYDKCSRSCPIWVPEQSPSYRYSIRSVEALRSSVCAKWSLVYPPPIPPIIIRLRDLAKDRSLPRCRDGTASIVATSNAIWRALRERGVDEHFRPINTSRTVDTKLIKNGDAYYYPQHTVASKFAVNVFLEVVDPTSISNPQCDYLGAYVLRKLDCTTVGCACPVGSFKIQWTTHAPDRSMAHRNLHPGKPKLAHVQFCYYKWDRNMVGLADEMLKKRRLSGLERLGAHLD